MTADHDLLFGLLALQNGLIDQGQLVAAFQAWTRDKARSLADHLLARGDLDADQRAGVEAMVGLHLTKHGGDAERSLAAVPAGRSTRERLAALGDTEVEASLAHVRCGGHERTRVERTRRRWPRINIIETCGSSVTGIPGGTPARSRGEPRVVRPGEG